MAPARWIAIALFAVGSTVPGCGSDDDGSTDVDAASGIDAPMACVLAAAPLACTIGNDAPCTAMCGGAYCYTFGQLPNPVCTQPCTIGSTDQCPSGWSCNNMGRCRPP